MLFAFTIFLVTIFLLDFEVVVGAVIVQDLIISFSKELTVFVSLRLEKVTFIRKNTQCTIHIMEFIGGGL